MSRVFIGLLDESGVRMLQAAEPMFIHLHALTYVDIRAKTLSSPAPALAWGETRHEDQRGQYPRRPVPEPSTIKRGFEAVVPNPNLTLMDQVRSTLCR